jgi:hypothetical protein
MRWGYSPFTHRTTVSHVLWLLIEVHGSGDRHPLTIPRRDVRRTSAEWTIRDDRTGKRDHALECSVLPVTTTRNGATTVTIR